MPGPIDYSLINHQPDLDSEGWWEGTAAHRLLVPSCEDCAYRWFPPGPLCPSCRSMNVGWHEAEGRGVIAGYVVVCHPVLAAFREAVPYVVALVELPDCANANGEPVRIGGVLIDDEDAAAIGAPVEVVYDHAPDDAFVVPRWRVSGEAADGWRFEN